MEKNRSVAPFRYLFITLIWSWLFWFGAVFTGQHFLEFPAVILSLLGFLGPFMVAVVMVKLGYWDDTVKSFLRDCFDPRRLKMHWYLYIIGLVVILVGAPLLFSAAFSEKSIIELVSFNFGFFLLPGILAGALEEPGWRGYAQETLQRRMSVLASSLVIGVFWALWHWPLFFLKGYYHSTLGFGSSAFWFFNLSILVGSVIYAWLYNKAGRVVIAAVFYHALSNIGRVIWTIDDIGFEIERIDVVELIQFSVEAGLAIIIILAARKFMLQRVTIPKNF